MQIDASIVKPIHLYILLGGFIASFALIGLQIRIAKKTPIYAGAIIAILTAIITMLILPDKLGLGIALAILLAVIVGGSDEITPMSAMRQLAWQIIIASMLVWFGWQIPYITNVFHEGVMSLGMWSALLSVAWIVLVINTVNWIDGSDGLASGVGIVGFIALVFISLLPATQDNTTLSLALISLGTLLGFFLWNIPPAKAYLGTVGSWSLGIFLATTAMYGKIATAILVLAVPVIDAIVVAILRIRAGKKIWKGDTKHHIHHRMKDAGLSPQTILITVVTISALLGFGAIIWRTHTKILAIIALALAMIFFSITTKKRKN